MTDPRHSNRHNAQGFSLLEVVLVVAVFAILAGIAIILVSPVKQIGDSRNMERRADVAAISDAIIKYSHDTKAAALPIPAVATEICATGAATCTGLADLSALTANQQYVSSLPKDPLCATVCAPNGTGYKITKAADGRVTISAPGAERGKTITITR